MTAKELKYNILEDIEGIDDENLLTIIKTVLENYKYESLLISDKRKKILDVAKQQIGKSEYVSDEEITNEEEGWLKE